MTRIGCFALAVGFWLSVTAAHAAPRKVILDTDGDADYDDVVALMVAAVSPEVQVLGVVATGKDAERRGRSIAKALDVVGRDDIGVYLGAAPLSPEPAFAYMSQFPRRLYGLRPQLEQWAEDFAYAPQPTSGVDFYLQQMTAFPGEISVIVTGPLSTLGRAMQVADERGSGQSFRRAIQQVLFSGGDVGTVEYNVYCDLGAAKLLFTSGVPIYQFGGEGEGKAYLQHDDRQRLWQAQTPATWALQNLYRLYRAGWDPTSPFVPILYDVHPVAFLIAGPAISGFEPAAIDVDADGRLVRGTGPPNANVRVTNHGDRLVEFFITRMTATTPMAVNHLRALERLAGADGGELRSLADGAIAQLSGATPPDRAALVAPLDQMRRQLPALGDRAARAEWHLDMAQQFLVGEPGHEVWQDPYTPTFIALYLVPFKILGLALAHKAIAAGVFLVGAVAVAWLVRGLWRSRRVRPERATPVAAR